MMTQRKRLEAPISVRKLRKLKALDSKQKRDWKHEAVYRSLRMRTKCLRTQWKPTTSYWASKRPKKQLMRLNGSVFTMIQSMKRYERSLSVALESYICTQERLLDESIVPEKLLIELRDELILDPFHQSEAAAVYAKHRDEKKDAHRSILEHLTEKRAKKRTRFLSQRANEMDAILCDIDTFFVKRRLKWMKKCNSDWDHANEWSTRKPSQFLTKSKNRRQVEW